MFSIAKKMTALCGEFLAVLCFLAMTSTSVLATEYRLFVNDEAACLNAGKSGSVCVVELVAAAPETVTAPVVVPETPPDPVVVPETPPDPVVVPETPPAPVVESDDECVVTSWQKCDDAGTETDAAPEESEVAPSVGTVSVEASEPSGNTVVTGKLDFGSAGKDAGKTRNHPVTVTNDIIAYPFSIREGSYSGSVAVTPQIGGFPDDSTQIRLWWSSTRGGEPLGLWCSQNVGREGAMYFDQTGMKDGFCQVGN
ncbi:MAG: hypothetical protein P8M13_09280, partial [Luminiphilus sp.]|nr:hypothetical protein [Luminiphilus sp.]